MAAGAIIAADKADWTPRSGTKAAVMTRIAKTSRSLQSIRVAIVPFLTIQTSLDRQKTLRGAVCSHRARVIVWVQTMLGTIVASSANYRKRAIQLAKITNRADLACVIAALILIRTRRA